MIFDVTIAFLRNKEKHFAMNNYSNNNNNNPTRRGRRRRNRNRRRRTTNNNQNMGRISSYRLATPFRNQMIMPDSMIIDMPFTDTNLTFSPAASTFGSFRYRGNSPFDPDPLLGGESVLYYPTYSALYRRYRVLSVKVEVTIVNMETFPVYVTFAPQEVDDSANINSNARVLDIGEMPYAVRPVLLGPNGSMNRTSFTRIINWPKFVGNKQMYRADDSFASLNNANPANTLFLMFAACATTNFNNGLVKYVRIIYRVLWTDRNFEFASLRQYHDLCDTVDS